jgi:ADP-ribose pyrophosphatase
MKREYPELPLVGVGAVIVENGRVVVVKRGTPPLRGEWSIPGGLLEVGETLRQAAAREALEETGLIVEPGEMVGVYDRVVRDADGLTRFHYVLIDFLCRRIRGELRAGHDACDARWVTEAELPALNLAAETEDLLHKVLRASTGWRKSTPGGNAPDG